MPEALALLVALAAAGLVVAVAWLIGEQRRIRNTRRNLRRLYEAQPANGRSSFAADLALGSILGEDPPARVAAVESGGGVAATELRPIADCPTEWQEDGGPWRACSRLEGHAGNHADGTGHESENLDWSGVPIRRMNHLIPLPNADLQPVCGAPGTDAQSAGMNCNRHSGHDGDHASAVSSPSGWPSPAQPLTWPAYPPTISTFVVAE